MYFGRQTLDLGQKRTLTPMNTNMDGVRVLNQKL